MAVRTTGTKIRINGTDIGDVLAIGDIEKSRNTKEYSALNSETVLIAVGRFNTGDFSITVLLNPDDTGAQKTLNDAIENEDLITLEIELPNKPDTGTNGTIFKWEGAVCYKLTITPEEDGFYKAVFNVKTPGKYTVIDAA